MGNYESVRASTRRRRPLCIAIVLTLFGAVFATGFYASSAQAQDESAYGCIFCQGTEEDGWLTDDWFCVSYECESDDWEYEDDCSEEDDEECAEEEQIDDECTEDEECWDEEDELTNLGRVRDLTSTTTTRTTARTTTRTANTIVQDRVGQATTTN